MSIEKIIAFLFLPLVISTSTLAQSTVWTTIENISELGLISQDGKLRSGNQVINDFIEANKVVSIQPILPKSHSKQLLKVYEIKTQVMNDELLANTNKLSSYFVNTELGPNYISLSEPNDFNKTEVSQYALELISAKLAWDITTGNSSISIGISDVNVNPNHEELAGKIMFYDTTNIEDPTHGTEVAIIAAGRTDNNIGLSSIGYNSSLEFYRTDYNAILDASHRGVRIINISWASSCAPSSYVQAVMDEVYANGTTVVASAGNGGTCGGAWNLVYPASCEHVISVTGVGEFNNHEKNIGDTTITFQHNSKVDLSAPGYYVALSNANGSYFSGSGTSFSAPYVSGTIALMLSVDSCLSVDQIELILKSTSENVDAQNTYYAGNIGNGRLNSFKAVRMALDLNACETPIIDPNPIPDTLIFESVSGIVYPNNSTAEINTLELLELNVYPNPANPNETWTIEGVSELLEYELFALNGTIANKGKVENSKISIDSLQQGIYLLKLISEKGSTTKRMIIL